MQSYTSYTPALPPVVRQEQPRRFTAKPLMERAWPDTPAHVATIKIKMLARQFPKPRRRMPPTRKQLEASIQDKPHILLNFQDLKSIWRSLLAREPIQEPQIEPKPNWHVFQEADESWLN